MSSSAKVTKEKEEIVFGTFREIKIRNEMLKKITYVQFWKQSEIAHGRLLSAFDSKKGKMHMEFLQAQVPQTKSTSYLKQTTFEFEAKDVHPLDEIEMHRQAGEMVYSTFT